MYTSQNTIKISDLRKKTAEVVDEIAGAGEPVFIFAHSEPKVVMMSCAAYWKMKEGTPQKKATTKPGEKHGLDFFIDPPEDFLVKKKGIDIVKLLREEREDYYDKTPRR